MAPTSSRQSPLRMVGRLHEENALGFNWRSVSFPGSGNLGSGRTLRPDWRAAAKAWKSAGGVGKQDWEEYATRSGLFPDDIAVGWQALAVDAPSINATASAPPARRAQKPPVSVPPYTGSPVGDILSRVRFGEAIATLRAVLGEAASVWGSSAVNLQSLQMPFTPGPGLGFHTRTAEEVWKVAKQVADESPKEKTAVIIGRAVERAQALMTELTPEDMRMLEMAINWYLAGKSGGMEQVTPISNTVRTGGSSPGEAARSTGVS